MGRFTKTRFRDDVLVNLHYRLISVTTDIDVLHLIPELAAIGQHSLQQYCNEWRCRRIARGVTLIHVTDQLNLRIWVDAQPGTKKGKVFLDELVNYIVDRHFRDTAQRRELILKVRRSKVHWAERHYEIQIGRRCEIWMICKNCGAELQTIHEVIERQPVALPTTFVTCPHCHLTFLCDENDLQLRLAHG